MEDENFLENLDRRETVQPQTRTVTTATACNVKQGTKTSTPRSLLTRTLMQ
jgi:hypothetical protein